MGDMLLLQLYAGISYLNTGMYDKAHNSFKSVSSQKNSYRNEAKWYNALTYLKENNPDKSKVLLAEIINNSNQEPWNSASVEKLSPTAKALHLRHSFSAGA